MMCKFASAVCIPRALCQISSHQPYFCTSHHLSSFRMQGDFVPMAQEWQLELWVWDPHGKIGSIFLHGHFFCLVSQDWMETVDFLSVIMDYAGSLSDLVPVMRITTLSLRIEVTVALTSVPGCNLFCVECLLSVSQWSPTLFREI